MLPLNQLVTFRQNFQASTFIGQVGVYAQETIVNQLGILFVYSDQIVLVNKQSSQVLVPEWKSQMLWLPLTLNFMKIGLVICQSAVNPALIVDAHGKLLMASLAANNYSSFHLSLSDMYGLQVKIQSNDLELHSADIEAVSQWVGRKLKLGFSSSRKFALLTAKYPFGVTYVGKRKNKKGRPSSKPPKR